MYGINKSDIHLVQIYYNEINGKFMYFEANKEKVIEIINEFENASKYMVFDKRNSEIELYDSKQMQEIFESGDYDHPEYGATNFMEWGIYEICKVYKMAGIELKDLIKKIEK